MARRRFSAAFWTFVVLVLGGSAVALGLLSCRRSPGSASKGAGPLPAAQVAAASQVVAPARPAPSREEAFEAHVSYPPGPCTDGIDNDGDGLVDWQRDLGCFGPADSDETSGPRSDEGGFTTFDVGPESQVIYVSASTGDDANSGTSPEKAVRSLALAGRLVRDGHPDFLLLRRGDSWRGETLGEFKSGKSASERMVVASYGDVPRRPHVFVDTHFINHNGSERSFLAVVGIEITAYKKAPGDPEWNGTDGGGLRFVGGGTDILVEDCHVSFGKFIVQSYAGAKYERVEVRRSVVERAYHTGTCTRKPTHRPAGLFANGVDDMLIEDNLFDHNGWCEDVPDACATMYNQNLYLNGRGFTIKNNLIVRASSIGVKMAAAAEGEVSKLTIEGNFFSEGEIGVSVGGNSKGARRFQDVVVKDNVFSEIGVTKPTERTLAWGVDVIDNQRASIEGNYFNGFGAFGNSFGVRLSGTSAEQVVVKDNFFFGIVGRPITTMWTASFADVIYQGNTVVDLSKQACLVAHGGRFDGIRYLGGRYFSLAEEPWFCIDGKRKDAGEWRDSSGEQATTQPIAFVDPQRTLGRYAASLSLPGTTTGFLRVAKGQSRFSWREDLTAAAVNRYVKAGFALR